MRKAWALQPSLEEDLEWVSGEGKRARTAFVWEMSDKMSHGCHLGYRVWWATKRRLVCQKTKLYDQISLAPSSITGPGFLKQYKISCITTLFLIPHHITLHVTFLSVYFKLSATGWNKVRQEMVDLHRNKRLFLFNEELVIWPMNVEIWPSVGQCGQNI